MFSDFSASWIGIAVVVVVAVILFLVIRKNRRDNP